MLTGIMRRRRSRRPINQERPATIQILCTTNGMNCRELPVRQHGQEKRGNQSLRHISHTTPPNKGQMTKKDSNQKPIPHFATANAIHEDACRCIIRGGQQKLLLLYGLKPSNGARKTRFRGSKACIIHILPSNLTVIVAGEGASCCATRCPTRAISRRRYLRCMTQQRGFQSQKGYKAYIWIATRNHCVQIQSGQELGTVFLPKELT